MGTTHLWIVLSSLAIRAMFWSGAARGQDLDAAAIHYGDGVHAYFAGNSSRAEQSLSEANTLNSQDPRIYYFRALSLLRLGRVAEARGDMTIGAALEAREPQRFAVGTALERVQGRDRLLLEQFRRQARLEVGTNGTSGGQIVVPAVQSGTLRQRVVIPLEEYLQPGAPRSAAPNTSEPAPRTFAPPEQRQPAIPILKAPTQVPEDPFRDDPQQAPAPNAPVLPPTSTPNPDASLSPPPADDSGDDLFAPQ